MDRNMTIAEYEATYGVELSPRSLDHIANGEQAARKVRALMHPEQETLVVMGLDTRHVPLEPMVVSLGTVNQTVVHPRDVFRHLVRSNASAFIVAHNHPGGSLTLSSQDEVVRDRLREAAGILGIEMLDFLVTTDAGWKSGMR